MVSSRKFNRQKGVDWRLGAKHWRFEEQKHVWDWAQPLAQKTLNRAMKTENVQIWTTFLDV